MPVKIIICKTKGCKTPNIPYDEKIPSTPVVTSQIKAAFRDFISKKINKKTIKDSEIRIQVSNDIDSEIHASFYLKDLIEETSEKVNLNTAKLDDKGDIKVVFCDTGHPNYIID